MSTSFIKIEKIGFWARDPLIEAVQICIINEIEEQNSSEKWLVLLKKELALQALPIFYGGMSLCLEEFLTSNERKNHLLKIIDSISKKLNNPKYFSGDNFHHLRFRAMEILNEDEKTKFKTKEEFLAAVNDSRWRESKLENYKANYEKTFSLLEKLLKGELTTTAASPINYYY
jgi:hypothetical protein